MHELKALVRSVCFPVALHRALKKNCREHLYCPHRELRNHWLQALPRFEVSWVPVRAPWSQRAAGLGCRVCLDPGSQGCGIPQSHLFCVPQHTDLEPAVSALVLQQWC